MTAVISSIHIATTTGADMTSVVTAELQAGRGVVGDRYHAGAGKFSTKLMAKGEGDWQLTLVEAEELDRFVADEALDFGHSDFRRNIVTRGIRLNPLVGKRFVMDGVELEGIRLCEPCAYLAGVLSERLLPAMVGRAGLRARILTSGTITVGGEILGA
jgi:MOSC domain-containing protein YiiM